MLISLVDGNGVCVLRWELLWCAAESVARDCRSFVGVWELSMRQTRLAGGA